MVAVEALHRTRDAKQEIAMKPVRTVIANSVEVSDRKSCLVEYYLTWTAT